MLNIKVIENPTVESIADISENYYVFCIAPYGDSGTKKLNAINIDEMLFSNVVKCVNECNKEDDNEIAFIYF